MQEVYFSLWERGPCTFYFFPYNIQHHELLQERHQLDAVPPFRAHDIVIIGEVGIVAVECARRLKFLVEGLHM